MPIKDIDTPLSADKLPEEQSELPDKSKSLQKELLDRGYKSCQGAHEGIWKALLAKPYKESYSHAALSARGLMGYVFTEIALLPTEKRFGEVIKEILALSTEWRNLNVSGTVTPEKICSLPCETAGKLDSFFVEFSDQYQTRPRRVGEMLSKTDPSGQPIPEHITEEMIAEWIELDRYFNNVLHHFVSTTEEELRGYIGRLETITLEYVLHSSPASQNLEEFDGLIEEMEQHD